MEFRINGRTAQTRLADSMDDLEKITDLQIAVWGFEPRDAIPAHLMKSLGKKACTPIIAEVDGKPVGFVYTFPQQGDEQYLHMLGVHPDFRYHSIGQHLLREQRDLSRKYGIKTIFWTYDPLEGANAYLYLNKIGGVVKGEYARDNYGNQQGMNKGLPSDRVTLRWDLNSPRVADRLNGRHKPFSIEQALEAVLVLDNEAILNLGKILPKDRYARISVPYDFQKMKSEEFEGALQWRLASREAFETLFLRGFQAVDFFTDKENGRDYYLLERCKR